jgi:hypothetical protein
MRLTIIAGLIMGASLAIHSLLGARARASVVHAAEIRPARVSSAEVRDEVRRDQVMSLPMSTKPPISTIR